MRQGAERVIPKTSTDIVANDFVDLLKNKQKSVKGSWRCSGFGHSDGKSDAGTDAQLNGEFATAGAGDVRVRLLQEVLGLAQ